MIIDPVAHAEITNKCLCFHCGYWINPEGKMIDISLKSNISQTAGSDIYNIRKGNNIPSGYGAILRFHIECFRDIAGDEYCFDQSIWE